MNSSVDLSNLVAKAFGKEPGCLGACFVKNVPDLPVLRKKLLRLASEFALLPDEAKQKSVHKESSYLFGWSHGKEIMNGKPDLAKGSFYNNPIRDSSPVQKDVDYILKFPEYAFANVWPEDFPELREAFMRLGQLIVHVGKRVCFHCDKYLASKLDLPPNFIEKAISDSETTKARLLHYFPIPEEYNQSREDSWCGLHLDHSVITGLVSAIYFDETDPVSIKEVDKSDANVAKALEPAGLYIQSRGDEFVQVNNSLRLYVSCQTQILCKPIFQKVKIPEDCLAFQIGEAAQVASEGLLVATPHLVKGASFPNVARNTFAVFMQVSNYSLVFNRKIH